MNLKHHQKQPRKSQKHPSLLILKMRLQLNLKRVRKMRDAVVSSRPKIRPGRQTVVNQAISKKKKKRSH